MYRTKTETKLVWWPTPQDYNEAIQIPQASLQDPELKQGLPYTNALELPRSITGSFASVYRMHCKRKDFALRLFLSNIRDQQERYALISDFVQHDDLPYTVTFDFLKEGIKIHNQWLPALKMEWLEGAQLDDYIVDNLANPDKLGKLLDKFVTMMREMRRAGIAHGDLQHGNILVCNGELRLCDYDGMFVPKMKGLTAGELGHRNYQHPSRAAQHFGPYLDNFSAWIIYVSLRALQIDSRLMHQLGGGDDCLLFRQVDFADPLHSPAFAALEQHSDSRLKELGRFVRAQLKNKMEDIPYLELPIKNVDDHELHPVSEFASVVKAGARIIRGNLPEWLQDDNATALKNAKIGHLDGAATTVQAPTSANITSPNLATNSPFIPTQPSAANASFTASIPSANNPSFKPPPTSATNAFVNAPPIVPPRAAPQSWTVPAKPAQKATWVRPGAPSHAYVEQVGGGKLNQLTGAIAAAAKMSQQQLAAAQRTAAKQTASGFHATTLLQLPVELQVTAVPRKVKFNRNAGRLNPLKALLLMFYNPIVWMMVYFCANAYGIDSHLATHGVMVPATVYSVEQARKQDSYSQIGYHYTVDNEKYNGYEQRSANAKRFEDGDGYRVGVLPENPSIHEPLNQPLGTKRQVDELYFVLSLAFNALVVGGILWLPLKRSGLPKGGKRFSRLSTA